MRWTLWREDERLRGARRNRVVLTPRRWRQVLKKLTLLGDDGDKKARSPGRARRKPLKPLRGECRGPQKAYSPLCLTVRNRLSSQQTLATQAFKANMPDHGCTPLYAAFVGILSVSKSVSQARYRHESGRRPWLSSRKTSPTFKAASRLRSPPSSPMEAASISTSPRPA